MMKCINRYAFMYWTASALVINKKIAIYPESKRIHNKSGILYAGEMFKKTNKANFILNLRVLSYLLQRTSNTFEIKS